MEHPTNPMMITVVIRFIGQINYDSLITDLTATVARFRRLRQRIVRPQGMFRRPYWDDDPTFRVEDHVERVELQQPADDSALGVLVNSRMNTMLDFTHPLWKITLADNHPDGTIMIVRIHHTIADGISLMRVLSQMTYPSTRAKQPQVPADNATDAIGSNDVLVIPQTMAEAAQSSANGLLVKKASFANPKASAILAAAARIIFRWPDPPTIFKGPLGKVKKAVWSEPFSMPEIKQIAQFKQATINDVVMAISAGAIRHYMDLHHDPHKRNIRAFIMVNMRGLTFDDDLGNKFGLVFLTLPINLGQPLDRLDAVKRGMDLLKASAEYAASYVILNILGQLPGWVEHLAIRILDTKGTVVATNVPGSRHELMMAEARIQSLMGWVPQSGRIGVGLSFISYNDQLIVGLNADAGVIPDPEKFLELFSEEYRSYRALLLTDTQT